MTEGREAGLTDFNTFMSIKKAQTRIIEINGQPFLCDRTKPVRESVRIYEIEKGVDAAIFRVLGHTDRRDDGREWDDIVDATDFEIGELPLAL